KVLVISHDGHEESYDVVDINLAITVTNMRDGPIRIKANGVLFSEPDLELFYNELLPGQWIEMKIKGKVECDAPSQSCSKYVGRGASIGARWYERKLTHRVDGCNVSQGNFVRRQLATKLFEVALRERTDPE